MRYLHLDWKTPKIFLGLILYASIGLNRIRSSCVLNIDRYLTLINSNSSLIPRLSTEFLTRSPPYYSRSRLDEITSNFSIGDCISLVLNVSE